MLSGDLKQLQHKLQIQFRNAMLLKQAFTHASYVNEHRFSQSQDNERLEFLGDAVLELTVSEFLYNLFPDRPEGELTKLRAAIVCEPSLVQFAVGLDFGRYVLLGKGEESSGGRTKSKNLADVFEAVIGALYLDQGLAVAAAFVMRHLAQPEFHSSSEDWSTNYKALLQETTQARNHSLPKYRTVMALGPDHDKEFTVEVLLDGEPIGRGVGRSKKTAEFAAAREALELLQSREE